MTTAPQAKQLTIAALLVAGTLSVVGEFAASPPRPDRNARIVRVGIGITILGVVLAGMAEFAPQLAGAFAMLLLLTSLFVYGGPAVGALGKVVK